MGCACSKSARRKRRHGNGKDNENTNTNVNTNKSNKNGNNNNKHGHDRLHLDSSTQMSAGHTFDTDIHNANNSSKAQANNNNNNNCHTTTNSTTNEPAAPNTTDDNAAAKKRPLTNRQSTVIAQSAAAAAAAAAGNLAQAAALCFAALPFATQHLLNSKAEFDPIAAAAAAAAENNGGVSPTPADQAASASANGGATFLKSNKQMQLYVSCSYTLVDECNRLLDARFRPFAASAQDVFAKLKAHCLKHDPSSSSSSHDTTESTYDLNVIDLNMQQHQQQSIKLNNKYFRRLLSQLIIKDLLNVEQQTTTTSSNYASSHSIFVLFVSDVQFDDDDDDDDSTSLMLPERVSLADYQRHCAAGFGGDEAALFARYYKLVSLSTSTSKGQPTSTGDYYALQILEKMTTSSTDADADVDVDVDVDGDERKLLAAFRKLPQAISKLVTSLQEEEIELITRHADPASIIWVHLTRPQQQQQQRLVTYLISFFLICPFTKITSNWQFNCIQMCFFQLS